ncbi:MAG: Gfo/Idh/MocA family oxidoreductase [Nitrospira sp.]|nr:Gfo/Idh/MocA family oxidoreductase [Nitrospira sp.]MCP9441523.1 Gfo/Idh/MocA family oxidoreductase [Nitrospira sp.]
MLQCEAYHRSIGIGAPIGIGLIGAGRHGIRYARHIVHDLPSAVLRAVCRRQPDRGLDLPGAESVMMYGAVESLVADPTVEVVLAVVPPVLAPEICRLAVQARKPLLVEKPLAVSGAEARAMVSMARQAAVPLMTAQTLRFDATIQTVRAWKERLGRSERLLLTSHVEVKDNRADHAQGYGGRGALLEIGVHLLDLVRYLTGEEVREVRCTMNRPSANGPETVVSAHLTTEGGTVCVLDIARVSGERVGTVEWIGSRGRICADWPRRLVCWIGHGGEREEQEHPPSQTVLFTLRAFLQSITDGSPMPITGEDGCRAVEIADACYRSAELNGAPVSLPGPSR